MKYDSYMEYEICLNGSDCKQECNNYLIRSTNH